MLEEAGYLQFPFVCRQYFSYFSLFFANFALSCLRVGIHPFLLAFSSAYMRSKSSSFSTLLNDMYSNSISASWLRMSSDSGTGGFLLSAPFGCYATKPLYRFVALTHWALISCRSPYCLVGMELPPMMPSPKRKAITKNTLELLFGVLFSLVALYMGCALSKASVCRSYFYLNSELLSFFFWGYYILDVHVVVFSDCFHYSCTLLKCVDQNDTWLRSRS